VVDGNLQNNVCLYIQGETNSMH